MDKDKSEKEESTKDSAQNEELLTLLLQIRKELINIREKLQKQIVE